MFGKWKWLAMIVAWAPLLITPAMLYLMWSTIRHAQPGQMSPFTSMMFAVYPLAAISGLCATAGMIWFIVLIVQHPKMPMSSKCWRVVFLLLSYAISAPFVAAALSDNPWAPPKKILNLD